jgi:hypothetical protein
MFAGKHYVGVGYCACLAVVVSGKGASVSWGDGKITVANAESIEVYSSSASLYDRKSKRLNKDKTSLPRTECEDTVARAATLGYATLRKRHVERHLSLFDRTSLKVRAHLHNVTLPSADQKICSDSCSVVLNV